MAGPTIRLAGTPLPNAGTGGGADTSGNRWYYGLDGWDGADVRSDRLTIPGVWGAVAGEWDYEPRALVLHGLVYCLSETAMWACWNQIAQLSDATDLEVELRVTVAPSFTLACQVRRAGKLEMTPRTDKVIDFSIPLVALDPRKYDLTVKTQVFGVGPFDEQTVTMAGSARRVPYNSLAAVGGPSGANGLYLKNATDDGLTQVHLTGHIDPGETVTLFPRTQTATSSSRGTITGLVDVASVWHDLMRGGNDVSVWVDSGSVVATLAWQDAWV